MTDDRSDAPAGAFVLFRDARSPFEARIVVAVLEDAGIPAYVPGGLLVDEFAMSQRLMNLQGVEIHVPPERIEDAERALADAKASGAALAEELADEAAAAKDAGGGDRDAKAPAGPNYGYRLFVVLLVLLVPVLATLWLDARAALIAGESPLYDFVEVQDGLLARWKGTDRSAYRMVDADHDGVPDQHWTYGRDGALVSRSFDVDEDGIYERHEQVGRDGGVTAVFEDRDQDGRTEVVTETRAGGLELVWTDTDGDVLFDRLEVRRNGELVRVQVLRGDEGFQTVR